MKHAVPAIGVLALVILSLCACQLHDSPGVSSSVIKGSAPATRGSLGSLTYRAVDELVAGAPELRPGTPLIVTTVSDAELIDRSSPLGNMIAELMRTRLVQAGLTVSEMRLRSSVLLDRQQGEMMLSRNRRALMQPPNVAAIATGTYAVADLDLYVSLKIISTADARIIAAADFVLPRFQNVNGLLFSNDQHSKERY